MARDINPLQFTIFCLGKKMPTQNKLFSICVGKIVTCAGKKNADAKQVFINFRLQNGDLRRQMVTCLGKMVFLYYYFLLSYNKLQQQIKLIAQCLYFLIRSNTCQSLSNTYDPCHVCHHQKKDKRRQVTAQKQQNTLNRTQSSIFA